jgi:micrococcal nuclease
MYIYPCKVLNVVDGDTIDIELDLGFHIKMKERVRLIGVDTPEVFGPNAEPAGLVASQFTKDWIEKRRKNNDSFQYHSIKYNARDKYGRSLGRLVWTGGYVTECLNDDIDHAGITKKTI